MLAPSFSIFDYLQQFLRLLPRGRVWHRGWGTTQAADLLTLMPTWVRLHERANDALVEAFPCTTMEMLPEWEATLGLPDPCIGELPTVQQRQIAVCAKFVLQGGATVEAFQRLGAALGFEMRIVMYAPFRADINTMEQPLYSEAWAWAWGVILPPTPVTYFRVERSTAEEPLAAWGGGIMECFIKQYAPAHTIPIFIYTLLDSVWDDGFSIWDLGASIWDEGVLVE
jgi:uncharacterized protein YmfQ (DUF2313 family)